MQYTITYWLKSTILIISKLIQGWSAPIWLCHQCREMVSCSPLHTRCLLFRVSPLIPLFGQRWCYSWTLQHSTPVPTLPSTMRQPISTACSTAHCCQDLWRLHLLKALLLETPLLQSMKSKQGLEIQYHRLNLSLFERMIETCQSICPALPIKI